MGLQRNSVPIHSDVFLYVQSNKRSKVLVPAPNLLFGVTMIRQDCQWLDTFETKSHLILLACRFAKSDACSP
jgi:hypothetical protein